MSYYALVCEGKVLGLRENSSETALGLAEKTALVMFGGAPIAIYEIEGAFPHDADAAKARIASFIATHAPEAVSVIDLDGDVQVDADPFGEEPETEDTEATGVFTTSGSGIFPALASA